MSSQAMPSSRWARRSRSARCSASARSVSKVQHHHSALAHAACIGDRARGTPASPGSGIAAGQREPPGDPLGGDQQPWTEPPGGAQRDHVGRGPTRRCAGSRPGSRGCRARRRRGSRRWTGGGRRRRSGRGRRRPARAAARPGRGRCPGTRRRRRGRTVRAARRGGPPPRWSPAGSGRRSRWRPGCRGLVRYWSRNSPAATNSGMPSAAPSAGSAGAVETLLAGARQHGVDLAGEAARAERVAQRVGPAHRLRVRRCSSSRSTTSCSGALRAAAAALRRGRPGEYLRIRP